MPRRKEPIDLLIAKGKSHLTESEIEERREKELKVPFDDIEVPECLTDVKQRAEFLDLAEKMKVINIYKEFDADVLARFVMSKALYWRYSKQLEKLLKAREVDLTETGRCQTQQDKAFKQVHAAATALGFTPTSRCKIEIPVSSNADDLEL